jgi:hypothetical protein
VSHRRPLAGNDEGVDNGQAIDGREIAAIIRPTSETLTRDRHAGES